MTWNPPDDGGNTITHYLLNYAEGDSGQFETDIRVDAPANRHTITGLQNGTTYFVVIGAVNAVGTADTATN